jgi:hypothetical protein
VRITQLILNGFRSGCSFVSCVLIDQVLTPLTARSKALFTIFASWG